MADPLIGKGLPSPEALEAYIRRVRTGGLEPLLRERVCAADSGSAQGLMVLRAILVLAPWLQEASLHGLLATCVPEVGPRPFAAPAAAETYASLRAKVAPDMASTGFKGILAHQMEDLAQRLDLGLALVPLLQVVCEALPVDLYWNQRAIRRLEGPIPPASGDSVRVLCEGGLVEVLNHFGALLRRGEPILDLLVEGASRKLLEASRELQGRTSWIFLYLATLPGAGQAQWLQAAALVNLFPSEDWPSLDTVPGVASAEDLLDAILDAEPGKARVLGRQVLASSEPASLLPLLAEAAAASDPVNDNGHRLLATAALAELLPLLGVPAQAWAVYALAISLATTQTGGERVLMGRKAWLC
ncbi:MAG: hypothetical protein H6Q00_666 [Holophagaceae bacterium]|nr:hypothetical protein [Holophagaceae bacterium]